MIYGWDLGGAHAKLAVVTPHGQVRRVAQVPCELWLGVDRLESALRQLTDEDARKATHAVTMTGELVDLFPDRGAGVRAVLDAFQRVIRSPAVKVFAAGRFVDVREAASHWAEIASANWLATARLVAQCVPQALVLDIGSTTTDVLIVADREVQAQGSDDRTRLAHEELVYTGVTRTPLMALARRVPFAGEWVGLMAEHFATTADVYRITGELEPAFDHARTADGRGRSQEESLQRLARMIGCDRQQASLEDWQRLAAWLARAQRQLVCTACDRQLSRGLLGHDAPVVTLGVGRFLAAGVAADLGRRHLEFAALAGVEPALRAAVDVCGPAFATARLAART
jgi:probable H4MPT-linked C1 transfer pathway protein